VKRTVAGPVRAGSGFILRRGELVAPDATVEGLSELPLWLAVADSQGGIGHLLCLAIDDALLAHDRPERAVAVLTQR
jgi:carbamate kinase